MFLGSMIKMRLCSWGKIINKIGSNAEEKLIILKKLSKKIPICEITIPFPLSLSLLPHCDHHHS